MPVLEINTNTTVANKKEIAQKASKLMAQLLGKPESVCPFPFPIPIRCLPLSSDPSASLYIYFLIPGAYKLMVVDDCACHG